MKSETGNTKPIAIPQQRVAGNMFGREDAIRSLKCVSEAAFGCEREIPEVEYLQWDTETRAEYGQSGWCKDCQDKIFTEPDECTCQYVDVGVGLMPNPDNVFCPEHGDPDVHSLDLQFDYDPDMREDEPPFDLHLIKWPEAVL